MTHFEDCLKLNNLGNMLEAEFSRWGRFTAEAADIVLEVSEIENISPELLNILPDFPQHNAVNSGCRYSVLTGKLYFQSRLVRCICVFVSYCANLFLGQFHKLHSTVNSLPRQKIVKDWSAYVFPDMAVKNEIDYRVFNFVFTSKGRLHAPMVRSTGGVADSDLFHLGVGQYGLRVFNALMIGKSLRKAVAHIFQMGKVLKIAQAVISTDAVDVVPFFFVGWHRANERLQHQTVNHRSIDLTIQRQTRLKVDLRPLAPAHGPKFQQVRRDRASVPSSDASDAANIADFISAFVSDYGPPDFICKFFGGKFFDSHCVTLRDKVALWLEPLGRLRVSAACLV